MTKTLEFKMSFKTLLEKKLKNQKTKAARVSATLNLLKQVANKKSNYKINEIDLCDALLCLKDISTSIPENKRKMAAQLEIDLYEACNSKVKKTSFWKFLKDLFK